MRRESGASLCLILSLIGISLAIYLVIPHLGLIRGELLGGAACGSSEAFNCHVVTASKWSTVLGMPLALWGLIGYLGIFGLSLLARQSAEWAQHALTLTFLLAIIFVGIDLVLFALMAFAIRSFCMMCLLTYVVNVILLVVSARSLEQPWPRVLAQAPRSFGALVPSREHNAAWLFWGIALVGITGVVSFHVGTTYMGRGNLANFRSHIREFLRKQPRVFLDIKGDPAHGPAGAPLQVVEFSDFRCPACQRASRLTEIIRANHRNDARFVFKNYPLDMTCNNQVKRSPHPGACRLAAASECAHKQGMFWAFHDHIFEEGPSYGLARLREDAKELGLDVEQFQACLASGEGMAEVKRDIAEAAKAKVASTPTFVINNIAVPGVMNPSTFEDLIAILDELGR